jgi:uncharacterized phage protein gp47/JayE
MITQYIDSPNTSDWGWQPDGFFYVPTIAAARLGLVTRFDVVAGTQTPTNESSPVFCVFSAVAEAVVSNFQAIGASIDALDPVSARGDALDAVARRVFIGREAAAPSTVSLRLSGTAGTLVGAGSLFSDPAGVYAFGLDADATIAGTGFVDATATCTEDGPFAPSTITQIVNPTVGLASVQITPGETVSPGRYTESDAELRLRLPFAVWAIGAGTQDAVTAALLNVVGVEKARTYLKLQTGDIPAAALIGTFAPVIYPAVDQSIVAETLFYQLVGGCAPFGNVVVTYQAPTGTLRTLRYTVATAVAASVQVTGIAVDGSQSATYLVDIANNITTYLQQRNIGDTVFYGKVQAIVLGTTGVLSATVQIKKGAGSFGTSNLPFDYNEVPSVGAITVS